VKNTHGSTHRQYGLEVQEVFELAREGEDQRYADAGFEKLHNKQLLWHGSRLTNFVGIISQGLRIAPPEAPVTGYMFGKGQPAYERLAHGRNVLLVRLFLILLMCVSVAS